MSATYNKRKKLGNVKALGFIITISLASLVPLCGYGNDGAGLLSYLANDTPRICYTLLKTACAGFWNGGQLNCTNPSQLIVDVDTNLSGSSYHCPTISGHSLLISSCVKYCNNTVPQAPSVNTSVNNIITCTSNGGYMIAGICITPNSINGLIGG